MVEEISDYEVFRTLDLRSAFHQAPVKIKENAYSAFEANGNLYQIKAVALGVTNGVACFQHTIDKMIRKENIRDTSAYLNNVTMCGKTQQEHDENFAFQ